MTLHVTDVLPLSPAERGGLVAIDDYILRAAGAEFDCKYRFCLGDSNRGYSHPAHV